MSKDLTVKKSIRLNARISDVWEALTNPESTKKYFFNCKAISDWKVGSPIVFNAMVEGKEIPVVKGIVTAIEQPSLLEHSCFSPECEDVPSKHTSVTYRLVSENDVTELSVTQGRFDDEEAFRHTDTSWDKVLEGLRTMLEEPLQ